MGFLAANQLGQSAGFTPPFMSSPIIKPIVKAEQNVFGIKNKKSLIAGASTDPSAPKTPIG